MYTSLADVSVISEVMVTTLLSRPTFSVGDAMHEVAPLANVPGAELVYVDGALSERRASAVGVLSGGSAEMVRNLTAISSPLSHLLMTKTPP